MRFRLVLPEEYPDQGPGVRIFLGKKQESTSAQVVAVFARRSVSSDLYFTSDVFHPMVESSIFAR